MSRLGMLYALTDAEVEKLRFVPTEERYDYMLNEIEEKLFGSSRACELDKAWEGLHFCLCGGEWNETNRVPYNIIFSGEFLVDTEEEVITLKNKDDVKKIVEYLRQNDLRNIINQNFRKIDDEWAYKDNDGLEHTLGWSEDILPFYENAMKENCQVIFTVDF